MITFITAADLALVHRLEPIDYTELTMDGIVSDQDRTKFKNLRHRFQELSDFFKVRYDGEYGIFESERAIGNPVGRGGSLRRVWSGIFKGSSKKYYAAQISFVINAPKQCLEVGFYFGRGNAPELERNERLDFEAQLRQIGNLLAGEIRNNPALQKRYYELFELGFKAEIEDQPVSPEQWLANAATNPAWSSILFSMTPNPLGYIDTSLIDFYVSMVMPLMSVIPTRINDPATRRIRRNITALTPEERAEKAKRLALIGQAGEEFIMEQERIRLTAANIIKPDYPCHKALESDNEGYDILSCEPDGEDLYIEVKTTTMPRGHAWAKTFFISKREHDFYKANKSRYRLYRVWNIYDQPTFEEIDLETVKLETDGYRAIIPTE